MDAEATSMEVATWLCHLCCGKFLSVYSSKRDTVTFVIIIFFSNYVGAHYKLFVCSVKYICVVFLVYSL